MRGSEAARYALASGGLALLAASLLAVLAAPHGTRSIGFALFGWGVITVPGVGGGAWTVARHGDPGTGFLVAMVTCMLSRLIAGATGALIAGLNGSQAMWAFLGGLGLTFLMLQVFEVGWFLRRAKRAGHAG